MSAFNPPSPFFKYIHLYIKQYDLSDLLIIAEHFPPNQTSTDPDDQIDHTHNRANTPPLS